MVICVGRRIFLGVSNTPSIPIYQVTRCPASSYLRPYGITHSNQIVQGDQTREENLSMVDHALWSWPCMFLRYKCSRAICLRQLTFLRQQTWNRSQIIGCYMPRTVTTLHVNVHKVICKSFKPAKHHRCSCEHTNPDTAQLHTEEVRRRRCRTTRRQTEVEARVLESPPAPTTSTPAARLPPHSQTTN